MSLLRRIASRLTGSGAPPAPAVAPPAPPADAPGRRDLERTARRVEDLAREVTALRGLVHQQGELTREALHRAGWQSDDESAQQKLLHSAFDAVKGNGDIIAGPWTGEVGFELLYWIPFLNWLATQGLDGRRLIVVSRGGAAPWYRHLTERYVDVLDWVPPETFLARTSEGKRKQFSPKRPFDHELLEQVRSRCNVPAAALIHPGAMFRLFQPLWRNRATIDLVDAFTDFRPLAPPQAADVDEARHGLPPGYVLAKFYFSRAFPDTMQNRAFVAARLRAVSRSAPVVLLSSSVRLDDHEDVAAPGGSGIFVVDALQTPQRNLARQTHLIAGAAGFIGTYGGFSYLAPFYGVRSLSFFSRRNGFENHHLDLAHRVFDRLLPGGFLAVDARAADLLEVTADPASAAAPAARA